MTTASAPLPDARAVLALLANDETRTMIARVALGQDLGERGTLGRRQSKALDRLISGRVVVEADGVVTLNVDGLRAAVEASSPPRPEGVARFVRHGRIESYPASDADRIALLQWVGSQVLTPGERVGEREITERLSPYMQEAVLLRRYLVDYGVVDRNPDGTEYRLAAAAPPAPTT
ncbi:MAG: DUF2087 domain-containing protein [Pseudolysinimonas sp.]